MSPSRNAAPRLDVDRRPTALVLKSIIAFGWSSTAFGASPLPGSLADGPPLFGQLAAICVFAGCAVSVIGLLWGYLIDLLDGLVIEAAGLFALFLGAGMYAYALTTVDNFDQARPACFLSAGIACFAFVQYVLIWVHRRRAKKETAARAAALAAHSGAGDGQ